MATIATVLFSLLRITFARQLTRDDFPVPGAPVIPTRCARPDLTNRRSSASFPALVPFSTSDSRRESANRLPEVTASRSIINDLSLYAAGNAA